MYTFTTTISYYNENTDTIVKDFKDEHQDFNAEVVTQHENSIDGLITIDIEPQKNLSIFGRITEVIEELDLRGECWTLKDSNGFVIATEEHVNLI